MELKVVFGTMAVRDRHELGMASWLGALQIDLVRAAVPRLGELAAIHPA